MKSPKVFKSMKRLEILKTHSNQRKNLLYFWAYWSYHFLVFMQSLFLIFEISSSKEEAVRLRLLNIYVVRCLKLKRKRFNCKSPKAKLQRLWKSFDFVIHLHFTCSTRGQKYNKMHLPNEIWKTISAYASAINIWKNLLSFLGAASCRNGRKKSLYDPIFFLELFMASVITDKLFLSSYSLYK